MRIRGYKYRVSSVVGLDCHHFFITGDGSESITPGGCLCLREACMGESITGSSLFNAKRTKLATERLTA